MSLSEIASIVAPFAWPLIVLCMLLLVLRKIESTVNPIVVKVVHGLADQAGSNALMYGLAFGYGLSASLQALADQATVLNWPVVAAMAKILNPFVVGLLAFAAKNDFKSKPTAAPNPPAP